MAARAPSELASGRRRYAPAMAQLVLDDTHVHVRLSALERAGALHGDLSIPRSAVSLARATDQPFAEVRGIRAPGTGVPRAIALGTWRRRHGKDFVAVRRGDPEAVVLELEGVDFARVVVGVPDAASVLAQLRR